MPPQSVRRFGFHSGSGKLQLRNKQAPSADQSVERLKVRHGPDLLGELPHTDCLFKLISPAALREPRPLLPIQRVLLPEFIVDGPLPKLQNAAPGLQDLLPELWPALLLAQGGKLLHSLRAYALHQWGQNNFHL